MLRLASTRVSLVSRRSPRSALTAYRAFSYPSADAGEDGVPAASSQPQTTYTPTQKHVMDKCKEMHASIMPLNEKVGNMNMCVRILDSVSLSHANKMVSVIVSFSLVVSSGAL
jgi:hypothetical protein